ncbi:hypothetical protein BDV59DRAFT_169328 [Aspergillus ambiguus]|uniref:uncharacterized protein n=1 Tax=Aspergillus ambiguus TaxID=176160 RepID=UPI003CCDF6A9
MTMSANQHAEDKEVFEKLSRQRSQLSELSEPPESEADLDAQFDSDDEDQHDDAKADDTDPPDEKTKPAEKNPPQADKLEFTHQGRYIVHSRGHEIGLTNEYPLVSVRSYEIKINKPHNWALRRRIKRGIRPHSILQLMDDVIRCGFLTHAELVAHVLGIVSGGGTVNDTAARYLEKLGAGNAGQQALSNEKV